MEIFLQAVFSGIAQGAIYALIALGYSVIFRTMQMGHFAQGEFYALGAFFGMALAEKIGPSAVLVFMGAGICTSVVMLIVERLTYRPQYNRPMMGLLLTTMGMQYIVQQLCRQIWGSDVHRSPMLFPNDSFKAGPVIMNTQSLIIICICAVLMVALSLFMKYTKTGMAMNAVAMNRKAASLMGVKTSTIIMATYVIAAFLAAIAGCMMGPIYTVSYSMGSLMGNKAMTAAVMGGFGSLPGAMLGGILLGIVETLCGVYISSAYKDAFSFLILIIVLFWRPQGLLGKAKVTKV